MDNRRVNYTYRDSGFSGFLRRTIDNNDYSTLREASSTFRRMNNQTINFDQVQTSGSLGSIINAGEIEINGVKRGIYVYADESHTDIAGAIGNLDA